MRELWRKKERVAARLTSEVHDIRWAAWPTMQTFSEAFGCGRPEGGPSGTDGTIEVVANPLRAALRPAPPANVVPVDFLEFLGAIVNEFS